MLFHCIFFSKIYLSLDSNAVQKLQKYSRIPNSAEPGFLSCSLDTSCLLTTHVFCEAGTELAKENTVLVSKLCIVYIFCVK